MVTVQQIKPMSPSSSPPSSSSLAASLVPLIKPLVMKLDKQLTTTGQMKMQKRVIAVPMKNGGTRLVTITGTNLGQVLTSSQRKVLIANNKLQDSPTPEQEEEHQQQQNNETEFVHCNSKEAEYDDDIIVSDGESHDEDPNDEDYVVPGRRHRRSSSKHRKTNNTICNGRKQNCYQTWDPGNVPQIEIKRRDKRPREQNKAEDSEELPQHVTQTALTRENEFPEEKSTKSIESDDINCDRNISPKVNLNENVFNESDSSCRKSTIKEHSKKRKLSSKEMFLENELDTVVRCQSTKQEMLTTSPLRKKSIELSSSVSQLTNTNVDLPKIERKNYPKITVRLTDVLGPDCESSRDQICRLSTSKSTLTGSLGSDLEVPNHEGLLNNVDLDSNRRRKTSSPNIHLEQQCVPESKPEEPSSCTEINAVVPSEAEFSTSTAKSSAKMRASSPAAVARFSRRRNSTGKRKKEAAKSSTPKPQTSVRERRKSNEGKNSQAKGRRRRSSEVNNKVQHDEKDDSESESDESWDSEDDPDRLWCICKKPHNNCFMICCDSCEDWFHGKCVGVTKSMGKQMELNGVEWVCPNCIKKKEIEEKEREKQKDKEREKQKEKEREKQKEKEREMEKEREKQ
ncbi:hypothetical protein C0J52_01814 [Blattella germanica]|nr:hypothetical protein C0J52_01814 [Blattella germanica]